MSDIDHLLNSVMNVYTITDGKTPTGGVAETETLKHENVPCLIEVLRARERELLGREGVVSDHMIYAGTENAIISKDVIKIGSKTFDIQYPDDVQEKGHHLEINVLERK